MNLKGALKGGTKEDLKGGSKGAPKVGSKEDLKEALKRDRTETPQEIQAGQLRLESCSLPQTQIERQLQFGALRCRVHALVAARAFLQKTITATAARASPSPCACTSTADNL